MSDITYETRIIVRLEKKIIGEIKNVGKKFSYFPKGSKSHGDLFDSINDVKKSLEDD